MPRNTFAVGKHNDFGCVAGVPITAPESFEINLKAKHRGIIRRWGLLPWVVIFLSLFFASCASVYTTGSFNISGIYPEKRTNGYILRIEAKEKIGRVEAWFGEDNWLYVSVPDTSVNMGELNKISDCPLVSKMALFRFSGSVQVTLQLKEKFDHVSVLSYPDDNNVYVVLYRFKEG